MLYVPLTSEHQVVTTVNCRWHGVLGCCVLYLEQSVWGRISAKSPSSFVG